MTIVFRSLRPPDGRLAGVPGGSNLDIPLVQLDPGQLVLVVVEMAQGRAGDRGEARGNPMIGLALELDRADKAAAGTGEKPALDEREEPCRIARDIAEEPIDGADLGGV